MSLLAGALEGDELLPLNDQTFEEKKIDVAKRWTQVLARALILGLIVGLIMVGVTVISSYIAVGAAPNWRTVAASSFSSFMLTTILTFVINYI